ncbi:MAG TPA: SDR family oxidoreductase [Devosia sp.]|nr:SDR family oxidoreductase [Devosia sp.]
MGSLQGQNVVVVGGSQGVGRSIVEAAHREGASVLAVARGEIALLQLTSQVSGVHILMADATEDTAPVEVFSALAPDVLVICAGAPAASVPLQDQTWKDFSANWETDVRASFLFCQAALRAPLKPGTRIIVMSSGGALTGGPPFAGGYSGSKRMQMFLAGHCQKESDRLGLGLRFMALAPMGIMPGTGVGDGGIEGFVAYTGAKADDLLASMTHKQTPADVARAVVELATAVPDGCYFSVSGAGLACAS